MAASLAVIGACLKYGGPQSKTPAAAAAAFIFIYDTFFAIGWLGVGWVCLSIQIHLKSDNM